MSHEAEISHRRRGGYPWQPPPFNLLKLLSGVPA
jgi:hypothetical protein